MKRLNRHGRVVVLDGARVLTFENTATPPALELKLESSRSQDNPPTREQGSDLPGRINDSTGRRSAMETTDYHQMAEDRFVAEVANTLARAAHEQLVVVAPPAALAAFRRAVPPAVQKAIVLEIGKDLTKHPVKEIAAIVAKALDEASA